MAWLYKAAITLVIIGAINWLLVGLFQWDLVQFISGMTPYRESTLLSRIIYSLVGISGLYLIPYLFKETIDTKQN